MQPAKIDAVYNAARKLHAQGRLAEAEKLYLVVLKSRARDFDLLDALANLALQTGRMDVAVERLKAAIAVRPDVFVTRFNLGTAFRHFGRLGEALAEYDAAIALDAADATWCAILWTNRGEVLRQLKRLDEAVESADRALSVQKDFAQAWHTRGNALYDLGRPEEAAESLERALALRADYPEAWNNFGNALRQLGRWDDAITSYDRAIALKPNFADALNNRGLVFRKIDHSENAISDFDRAIALNPTGPEPYINKANALLYIDKSKEAIEVLEILLSIRPNLAEAWSSIGVAFEQFGRLEDAIKSFNRAIELNPESPEFYLNKAVALVQLGYVEEAISSFDHAISLNPKYSDAHFNRSLILLMLGKFEEGWIEFEHRKFKEVPIGRRDYPQPYLAGVTDQRDEVVLIHTDQGFGDTIQFCRYVPMLEDLGGRVLFAAEPPLHALIRSLSPTVEIVDDDAALNFDYHSPLMSLPLIFDTRLETIPAKVPYLSVEPERVARWRNQIGANGFRIGVCWRGSQRILGRPFSPTLLTAIAALPDVRLISLQKGEGEAELDAHPDLKVERLEGLDEGPDAFMDTAAVMQTLDLVITCDTAVAHLAGALARPAWVALPYPADWRWLLERSDSPWYPTLRLFRQKTRGDWDPVFEAMEAALRERLAAGQSLPPS